MVGVHGSRVRFLSLRQSGEKFCMLSNPQHSLMVANQMLSLVGSVQPDPFSPEHTPQAKPDRAQSPQPPPHPILPEPIESEASDDDELDRATARPSSAVEGNEETLVTREKKKREKEKTKRKRKGDDAVAKAERKPKRKKASKRELP